MLYTFFIEKQIHVIHIFSLNANPCYAQGLKFINHNERIHNLREIMYLLALNTTYIYIGFHLTVSFQIIIKETFMPWKNGNLLIYI